MYKAIWSIVEGYELVCRCMFLRVFVHVLPALSQQFGVAFVTVSMASYQLPPSDNWRNNTRDGVAILYGTR